MKIIYCVYQLGVGGGIERVFTSKANYLVSQGHEVTVLTCHPLANPPVYGLDERVQIHAFDIDYSSDFQYGIAKRFVNTLAKMYRHWKLVREYLRANKTDIVVTTHAYEMAFLPFIKDGSKKVLELHSSAKMYEMQRQGRGGLGISLLTKSLVWRDKLVNKLFDAVGCLTEEDYGYRGRPSNMHVIPNPQPFISNKQSTCANPIVLAVGRLTEQKDYASLLDIWAKVSPRKPEWRLKIVGGGHLRNALLSQLNRLGLQGTAEIEPETGNVTPYYTEASIFAMTSNFEGFGMVLAEAAACGVPSISYDCPCGPSDIIIDGKTGYLVPLGDKAAFEEKLILLMDEDVLRMEMGRNALDASKRYSIEGVMAKWENLFRRLVYGQ